MKPSKRISLVLLAGAFSCCVVSGARAQKFMLHTVADLNTPIPEGSGNFTHVYGHVISGRYVGFMGLGGSGQQGVYFFDETGIHRVADLNTAIPDGTGTFTGLALSAVLSIDGRNVVYKGDGTGQQGMYLFDGVNARRIADLTTPIPGGEGNFTGFGFPKISGANVAFYAEGASQAGIYLHNGTSLLRVADYNTPIPNGSGAFEFFGSSLVSASHVFFGASGPLGQSGIYAFDGSTLEKRVDLNTAIPGGAGNFSSITAFWISGASVAFLGSGPGVGSGIYLSDGATLSKVVDTNTPIPDGTGNFSNFEPSFRISGGKVTFKGLGSGGQQGVYLFDGSVLRKVADLTTDIPPVVTGVSNRFTSFHFPIINTGSVVFQAIGAVIEGIYHYRGSTLSSVADTATPIPGGSGNFTGFAGYDNSGCNVVFRGQGSSAQEGIYLGTPSNPSLPAVLLITVE
ncbi:DUF7453 family protein [Desulfoferrobacter suflitae]|uniref:DUF7453 family protein n=1 Tax=Desulfoferrobacter suflitae TaxID=2865782 RepID=UPI00216476E7|nr:hypothetical protein [Desulfoferrobacter suflitae]MCK8600622.1 hypothetical protein [Desulfoferrobacter suflitae]